MQKRVINRWILFLALIVFLLVFLSSKPKDNKQPCLSLTFDDGLKSHYVVAYPELKSRDFSATFFIVAGIDKDSEGRDLMSNSEIQELASSGFEIGSHSLTHPMLTAQTQEEVIKEIAESKRLLEEEYGIIVSSIAFPYGDYNKNVLNMANKYYLNARSIYNQEPVGFFIDSFALQREISPKQICSYIEYAKENDLWLVLIFHDITDNPGVWDTSQKDFNEILDCARYSGITVDSLKGCREKVI